MSDSGLTYCGLLYFTALFHAAFFHSHRIGLFRCRFDSELRTGFAALAPSILPVISTNDFSLLAGIVSTRPSAFVEDDGFEPSALWVTYGNAVECALAANYARPDALPTELISQKYIYPELLSPSFLFKPAYFTAGWETKQSIPYN